MRNTVTSAEKLWVRTFKTGYKEVTLSQQPFNPAPCGYEDAEFTRTDLSQAAVAAALEAALAAVNTAREQVINSGQRAFIDGIRFGHDRSEAAIRALITTGQHDALAAHVAAEVAKARAEDADLLYSAWLGLRVLENIAKVKSLSGAADVVTPLLAEIEVAHPEFAPRSALRSQIGAKP